MVCLGVTELLITGDDPELEDITGFEESPVAGEWRESLRYGAIQTITEIWRGEAVRSFHDFPPGGWGECVVYNALHEAAVQSKSAES